MFSELQSVPVPLRQLVRPLLRHQQRLALLLRRDMPEEEREEFVPKHRLDALERVRRVPPVALVARLTQQVLVVRLDHLLQHRVRDVAQLERGRLGRDRLAVEDVRAPLIHAGEPGLCGLVPLFLPPGDDRRADDGVVNIAEVEALVAAVGISNELAEKEMEAHTSGHRGPRGDRIPDGRTYLAMGHPRIRTILEAKDIWSCTRRGEQLTLRKEH